MTKTQTFVNLALGTFWTIRHNVDSKNILTVGGRVGTLGVARRLHFPSRGEVRSYVDARTETKVAKGYVQVA